MASHNQGMDVTERNRAHWDTHASTYDSRSQKTQDQLISIIQAPTTLNFISPLLAPSPSPPSPPPIKILDYACGTGLITRALLPSITRAIGIDLSTSMVEHYNARADNQGLSPEEMFAYQGNLTSTSTSTIPDQNPEMERDDLYNFDIAVVGLGFHHFEDPALAARRLGERLKKGGVLAVVDFETHDWLGNSEDKHSHSHSHSHSHFHDHLHTHTHDLDTQTLKTQETVTHHGFSRAEIQKIFEDAGVGAEFGYMVLGTGIVFHGRGVAGERKDMKRAIFMARGVKS